MTSALGAAEATPRQHRTAATPTGIPMKRQKAWFAIGSTEYAASRNRE